MFTPLNQVVSGRSDLVGTTAFCKNAIKVQHGHLSEGLADNKHGAVAVLTPRSGGDPVHRDGIGQPNGWRADLGIGGISLAVREWLKWLNKTLQDNKDKGEGLGMHHCSNLGHIPDDNWRHHSIYLPWYANQHTHTSTRLKVDRSGSKYDDFKVIIKKRYKPGSHYHERVLSHGTTSDSIQTWQHDFYAPEGNGGGEYGGKQRIRSPLTKGNNLEVHALCKDPKGRENDCNSRFDVTVFTPNVYQVIGKIMPFFFKPDAHLTYNRAYFTVVTRAAMGGPESDNAIDRVYIFLDTGTLDLVGCGGNVSAKSTKFINLFNKDKFGFEDGSSSFTIQRPHKCTTGLVDTRKNILDETCSIVARGGCMNNRFMGKPNEFGEFDPNSMDAAIGTCTAYTTIAFENTSDCKKYLRGMDPAKRNTTISNICDTWPDAPECICHNRGAHRGYRTAISMLKERDKNFKEEEAFCYWKPCIPFEAFVKEEGILRGTDTTNSSIQCSHCVPEDIYSAAQVTLGRSDLLRVCGQSRKEVEQREREEREKREREERERKEREEKERREREERERREQEERERKAKEEADRIKAEQEASARAEAQRLASIQAKEEAERKEEEKKKWAALLVVIIILFALLLLAYGINLNNKHRTS